MTEEKKQAPQIRCSHQKLVKIEELKPHPKNPNLHTEEQIDLLAKIIQKTGFRSPIIVSKKSGYIVAGHGRLQASKKMGVQEVPCDFQEFASEAEETQHLIADNRIAELSDFDPQTLKDLIEELDTGENDLQLLGYSQVELDNLMSQFYVPEDPIDLSEFDVKDSVTLRVICRNIEELKEIQNHLGITAQETTGDLILEKIKK